MSSFYYCSTLLEHVSIMQENKGTSFSALWSGGEVVGLHSQRAATRIAMALE